MRSIRERAKEVLRQYLRRLRKRDPEPESPDDPYALVGAPKRPRTPLRSASAAAELDE